MPARAFDGRVGDGGERSDTLRNDTTAAATDDPVRAARVKTPWQIETGGTICRAFFLRGARLECGGLSF